MITSVIQWWSALSTPMKWLTGIGGWFTAACIAAPLIGRRLARNSSEGGCTPDMFPEAGRTRAERHAWQMERLEGYPADAATVIDDTEHGPTAPRSDELAVIRALRDIGDLGQPLTSNQGPTLIKRGDGWSRPSPRKRGAS